MLVKSILAGVAAVALVALAAAAFKKYGKDEDDPDGATGAHAGAMISALFLLVFAIGVIVPWTVADEAAKNSAAEAQAVVEAYWGSAALPAADRPPIRDEIKGYLDFVVGREWPHMADGDLLPDGWRRLDAIRVKLAALQLPDEQLNDARDDAVERIREAYAARRQRAADASAGLPDGVLLFTVLTGLVTILFPFLAGARPRGMLLVVLGVMAAMVGVSVYLVFAVNHAFTGPLAVEPEAFTEALQELARIP